MDERLSRYRLHTEEMLGEDFYRWLYTAFTRATHHLYLVNLPDEFVE